MGYCTLNEVQADFKSIEFTRTSLISIDDVTQFIVEADAVINSYVGKKYRIPIQNDSNSVSLMKFYSRTIVRDRVRAILKVKQSTTTGANSDVRGTEFSTKDVMASLKDIQASKLALSGATELVSGGAFYSSNAANNVQPFFQKGKRQW